jgi:isopentenyl-diphosphate delta-isomerase
MRAMIEHPELATTFSAARKAAPNVFLCANIGAVQLREPAWIGKTLVAMDVVKADALIVHLNPLQELTQPEGDRQFSGILDGIHAICNAAGRPVIAKETGAGFSRNTAGRLLAAGVAAIDVAGAGGTSWSAVELARQPKHTGPDDTFLREWGIPTVRCLEEIAPLKGPYTFDLIASGGVYGASEILKAMALGAGFTAMARPLIQVLMRDGENALHQWMETLHHQLRTGMLLLGVEKTSQLSTKHLYKVL